MGDDTPMIAYLAAGFSRKDEIAAKSRELQSLGVQVTSTWPWETVPPNCTLADCSDTYHQDNAARDLAEIDAADSIILFTQEPTKPFCRGGRMHEFGYAQAKGKRLLIVGPRENIFHYLPTIKIHATWEALIEEIKNGR